MRIRKRTILGPVVALAALGAVVGGTALAAPGDAKPENPVIERAAGELGVNAQTLTDALKNARARVMEERVTERLAAAVDSGRITRAEADEIQAWLDSRPAAANKPGLHAGGNARSHRGFHHGHGRFRTPPVEPQAEPAVNGVGFNL